MCSKKSSSVLELELIWLFTRDIVTGILEFFQAHQSRILFQIVSDSALLLLLNQFLLRPISPAHLDRNCRLQMTDSDVSQSDKNESLLKEIENLKAENRILRNENEELKIKTQNLMKNDKSLKEQLSKKLSCSICRKLYARSDDLYLHLQSEDETHRAHALKCYDTKCEICSRNFKRWKDLRKHMIKHTSKSVKNDTNKHLAVLQNFDWSQSMLTQTQNLNCPHRSLHWPRRMSQSWLISNNTLLLSSHWLWDVIKNSILLITSTLQSSSIRPKYLFIQAC